MSSVRLRFIRRTNDELLSQQLTNYIIRGVRDARGNFEMFELIEWCHVCCCEFNISQTAKGKQLDGGQNGGYFGRRMCGDEPLLRQTRWIKTVLNCTGISHEGTSVHTKPTRSVVYELFLTR